KSEGDCNSTGLLELVADARLALRWLRSLPEIDSHRVGVLGQSEGAVIALMLAAEDPDMRFFICQSGLYHNFAELLRWQAAAFWQLPSAGIAHMKQKAALLYWIYKQLEDLLAAARRGETYCRLGDETWAFNYYLPRVREHLDHPPSKYVAQVKCPVLILHGKLDHNCPYTEAEAVQQALFTAGNRQVTAHIFEGLDHSFRRLGHADEDFITAMQRPLDPALPEALKKWLQAVSM